MSSRRRLALVSVAAVLLTGCASFRTAAAVVNGDKIDERGFRRTLAFFAADPRFAAQFPGEEGEQQEKGLGRQLLTFLIHQELIEEHATQRGIEPAGSAVDQRLADQVQQAGGQEAFDQQLAKAGVGDGDVRRLLRAQVLREQVARIVVSEEIPADRLQQEYQARLTEFTEVHVAHILVQDEAEARDIAARATPGNFGKLAKQSSIDPGSKDEGGDLGTRPASAFVPPFDQATLDIPVGEIGGPVQTEFGWHIIHVIERTATPFEEARDRLLGELGEEVFRAWLLERVNSADIMVNPRYGQLDPASGEVVERRTTAETPEPQLTP